MQKLTFILLLSLFLSTDVSSQVILGTTMDSSAPLITVSEISVRAESTVKYCRIIPENNAIYRFASYESSDPKFDPYCTLYDQNGILLAYSDDSGWSKSFYLYDNDALTSGATYYLAIANKYGTFDIAIRISGGGLLPVELTSFTANLIDESVILNWQTATEINNYGFEVERSVFSGQSSTVSVKWNKVGFVEGNGNSNSPKQYSYTDNNINAGKYSYRLKQLDFDGKYEYSEIVNVEVKAPAKFELSQNYPNPFNPTTRIVPSNEFVSLKVYDILGNEVAVLVNEQKQAGSYEVNFDASNLTSGLYFYKIKSGDFTHVKKMMLVK